MENGDDQAAAFKPNDKVVNIYDPPTAVLSARRDEHTSRKLIS
jgi:hypothetical protein